MAGEVKQSPLADRVGPAFGQAYIEVFNELKGVEVEPPSGGTLPAGINNGVAHLKRINFGTFNTGNHKGKPYFQAFGVVQVPKEHGGVVTYGKQTKVFPEALCDTSDPQEKREPGDGKRRTIAEHLRWIISLIKLLNGQEDPPAPKQGEPWKSFIGRFEQYCHELCRRNIYFSFRTWQPDKTEIEQDRNGFYVLRRGRRIAGPFGTEDLLKKKFPRVDEVPQVSEVWEQRVDFTPEVTQMDDGTAPTGNGQARSGGNGEVAVVDDDTKYISPQPEQGDQADEKIDLDLLVEQAPENVGAREKLLELALQAGYTQEEVEDVDTTWEMVKEWIENPKDGSEGEADKEPEEERIPVKGQKVKAGIHDKIGKFKEVEASIVEVNTDKKTVDLRNSQTKAVYKGIAWDKLILQE